MNVRIFAKRLHEMNSRTKMVIGSVLAVVLAVLFFFYNLTVGPLHNLNDIGSWRNRLIFTILTGIVHLTLLLISVFLCHDKIEHMVMREILLTLSMLIFFLAINQKTFAYNTQIQPIIRKISTEGLSAAVAVESGLSVPALTLYALLTLLPVYDMYLIKLFSIACFELLCLIIINIASDRLPSWRKDALYGLFVILPQGFLSSACAAQVEIFAFLLGILAVLAIKQRKEIVGWVLFGCGAALSGTLWLILPILIFCENWNTELFRQSYLAPLTAVLCTLPGIILGVAPVSALVSLVSSFTSIPPVGTGAPGLFAFFPRAQVEEMWQYALLRPLELDTVTLAAENYTQGHFEILMHGLMFAGLAAYMGLCAIERKKEHSFLSKWLSYLCIVLICVPQVTMGAWIMVDLLCLLAVFEEPELRIPCVLLLFATAGGCCYPVTGEVLLSPTLESTICLAALGMLMGFWPKKRQSLN